MQKIRLMPCPFCGAEPELKAHEGNLYSVRCMNQECNVLVHTLPDKSKTEAIRAWNKRRTLTFYTHK